MADLIALLWDRTEWTAVEASVHGGAVRLLNTCSESWPEAPAVPASAAERGSRLKASLNKAGIRSRSVWLVLSREDVILRHLELPNATDEELPDLVRFQASARSSVALDQLLLDFIPITHRAGREQRDALCATIPATLLLPIRATLEAAGLELEGVTVSSVGVAELLTYTASHRRLPANDGMLGIVRDGQRSEIVVLQQRQLIYAHSARLPAGDAAVQLAAMQSETSRAVVAAQRLAPELSLKHGWLVADPAEVEGWAAALTERVGCPIDLLHPVSDLGLLSPRPLAPGEIAKLAAPVGLAAGRTAHPVPVLDFLHPRKAPPRRDPRKARIAAGAAAALLLIVGATAYTQLTLQSLDQQISDLTKRDVALTQKLKGGQPILAAATDVRSWLDHSAPQLGLLGELYQEMDGTERQYLSQYEYTAGSNEVLGKVVAQGNARDRLAIQQFQDRVDSRLGRRVKPKNLTLTSRDSDYPAKFELDFDLIVEAEKKPVTRKPVSAISGAPPAPAKP
jgi:Tfp pilus assembly PilM family ATPase